MVLKWITPRQKSTATASDVWCNSLKVFATVCHTQSKFRLCQNCAVGVPQLSQKLHFGTQSCFSETFQSKETFPNYLASVIDVFGCKAPQAFQHNKSDNRVQYSVFKLWISEGNALICAFLWWLVTERKKVYVRNPAESWKVCDYPH